MIPIIAIRPEPGCSATVALAKGMGLTVAPHPLFVTQPTSWTMPEGAFDAILLGSANALRLAGPRLDALRHLPAFCVGETTAQAARAAGFNVAGFNVAGRGSGGLQSVLPLAARYRRLLRLSGEARVPLEPAPGVEIETITCYRVASGPVGEALAETLQGGALVLLHSGEAAAHFSGEVDRLAIPRDGIHIACLAPRIAERAGTGWAALAVADRADDAALLALAKQMCQAAR